MPRAYLRLDPNFYERKALRQNYPPGAVAALVGCLCLGETQPQRGRFRDRRVLAVLLGHLGRWVSYLVEHGDLIEQDELPRLYIDGWDEWQEGDATVPERMVRLRNRRKGVTPAVTVGVTPSVTAARLTVAVEAEAVAQDKGGGGDAVTNGAPTTFMGYRPKYEPAPGEAARLIHDGTHRDADKCGVCRPLPRGVDA